MKRSLHAPLSRLLRELQASCGEAARTGAPLDELVEMRAARAAMLPRRAAILGAASGLAALPLARARATGSPRVVIVGAGLAGLACAQTLWQEHGIAASIHEWSHRAGGRVNTLRGYFTNGLVAEQHAELISSEHRRMRALVSAYGLTLENVSAHLHFTPDTAWFRGQRYTQAALAQDWQAYAYELFRDAVRDAPSATYRRASTQARLWDNMSVTEWVHRHIPGGTASPLGGLCLADVISEYGGPPDRQSALNLIYILGYDTSRQSGYQPRDKPALAGTDEKYHVRGGNDQVIEGMLGDLPAGAVNFGHRLLAVRETAGRAYLCSFATAGGTVELRADHVVLAIPPTTLRDVELRNIDLSPVQRRAIAGATLGNNAKMHIQLGRRPWLDDGLSGTVLTDAAVCGGWDAGSYQPSGFGHDAPGLLVGFPGGRPGQQLAARYGLAYGDDAQPAPAAMVADTLAQLEPIYPGITAAWANGPQKAWVNDGNIDPTLRGAYSYFQVGQFTSFGGGQALPAGNLHFAGEHTSAQYQGFMEGAVQSGQRAAAEIVA